MIDYFSFSHHPILPFGEVLYFTFDDVLLTISLFEAGGSTDLVFTIQVLVYVRI